MLVTSKQLSDWLKEHAGQNRICSITTLTPVRMVAKHRETKQSNPFWEGNGKGTIDHLQERLTSFGADYAKAVNRVWANNPDMIDAEGFTPYFAAAALWHGKGERINNYMARHKETNDEYLVYLQALRGDRNISLRQQQWQNRYTGEVVSYDDIAPYFAAVSAPSKKQRIEETGNVEVCPRTIHIENVLRIRSFDLVEAKQFDVIDINREPNQISV
jgi:hypothetical protein